MHSGLLPILIDLFTSLIIKSSSYKIVSSSSINNAAKTPLYRLSTRLSVWAELFR